jgi:hypothetical protein
VSCCFLTHSGQEDGGGGGGQQLEARADEAGEQGRLGRRRKDPAVHELPAAVRTLFVLVGFSQRHHIVGPHAVVSGTE